MSKVLIVANTKNQADLIAKMHDLRPWNWRYVHDYHHLQGAPVDSTVLIAANYTETPQRNFSQEFGAYTTLPMHEQIEMLKALGAEVAVVAT